MTAPQSFIVQLKRRHVHAGVAYVPGETLKVPASTAQWLFAQGIGFDASPASPKRPRKPKQPQP